MATKAEQFAKQQDALQKAGVDINKFNAAIAGGSSVEDAMKAGGYAGQKAQTTSSSVQQTATNKANELNTRVQNTQNNINDARNQLNSMSSQVAQNNSRNFQVGTGDVAEMPQQPKAQSVQQTSSNIGKAWEGLTYEQQQERLNRTAGLKDALAKKGIVSKTQPTTTTQPKTTTQQKTTQPQTPKQEQWDYQDNSQARMDQIAKNLNGYRQTMPQLFDDGTAFYNFFIKDKGRSQDQIDFLWDYFNRVQKYGKYDNMSPEQLGTGIANGDIPEDYLNTLKSTDPQKYQEVMAAKQNREDTIKNESFLNDAATMAGIEGWESENVYPQQIEWAWEQGLWVDEDENRVDDRREHYASEEEQGYQKQIADLNAANLDIDNTVKHTYDDLVERYPGAAKSTLMAMAQDRNSTLLREKENNLVELTRLQGYVGYMQKERQEMNKAGADSIAQLQDNLGMYYDYSPEGISKLAQAKYAATNVTLDQANNGTDTQKQMALQSVLDDYYDKYGSIIQRGEQQVINDVMAYAKKNGVSLSQALEENFLKPLRSKPEFSQLNTLQSDPYTVKSGDITYVYDPVTKTFSPIGGGATGNSLGGGTSSGQLYGFTNYTPITTEKKEATLENFMNTRTEGSDGGQCGEFVNDYLQSLGYDRLYTDPIDKKKAVTNSDTATVGSIAVMDSQKYPEYGHVAIVTDVQGDKVKLLESNRNNDHKVHTTRWVNKSDILGYFDPSKEPKQTTTTDLLNAKFGGTGPDWNKNGYFDSMKPLLEKFLEEGKIDSTDTKYSDLKNSYHITDQEFNQMAQNYARTEGKANELESVSNALEAAINLYEYVNGNKSTLLGVNDSKQGGLFDWLGGYVPKLGGDAYDAKGYYDTLGDRLTLDKLIETKKQGATYGAMSEGEWELLKNAATSLDWGSSSDKFQKNLEDMIYTMVRAIEEGGGKLPSNYAGSTASKEYLQWQKNGRYDKYKSEGGNKGGGNKGGGNSGEPEML